MFNHKFLILAISLLCVHFSSCSDQSETENHEHLDYSEPRFAHPVLLEWRDSLICTGVIDVPPQNLISIHAPVTGFVKSVFHYPGSKVQKGSVLAVLEHPSFVAPQKDLLEAMARKTYLKNLRTRMKELSEKDAVSMQAYEEADAEYQLNEARIMSLNAQLTLMGFDPSSIVQNNRIQQQLSLRAPVSGIITQMNINMGRLVNPDQLLIQMVDTRHKHIELNVFAKDLPRITEGMKVRFRLNPESPELVAEIFLINPMVDQERNSVQVHAHLEEADEKNPHLKPGTFIQAVIDLGLQRQWSVPVEAITEKKGIKFITVVQDKSTTEIRLHAGEMKQGHWLIPGNSAMADSSVRLLLPESDEHAH